MNRFVKVSAVILLLVLILDITACKPKEVIGGPNVSQKPSTAVDSAKTGLYWMPEVIPTEMSTQIDYPQMLGDTIYYFQNEPDYSSNLYSYTTGENEPKKIAYNTMLLYGFTILEDGTGWVAASDMSMAINLEKIDLTTGEIISSSSKSSSLGAIITLLGSTDHGFCLCLNTQSNKRIIAPFIESTGKLGDTIIELPADYNTGAYLSGESLFFSTSNTLEKIDLGTGERETIIDWIENDLNFQALKILAAEPGKLTFLSTEQSAANKNARVLILTETEAAATSTKTAITIATVGEIDAYLRNEIVDFNRNSDKVKIEIVYYAQDSTDETALFDGISKLNIDITTGKAPDILIIDQTLPLTNYVNKGCLEDLTGYIERSDDIRLLDDVTRLLTIDDQIPTVTSGFKMLTMIGNENIVGGKSGWTLAEAQQAIAQFPERTAYPESVTQTSFLVYSLILSLQDFYNASDGAVSFESEEFMELLKYVRSLPSQLPDKYVDPFTTIKEAKSLVTELVNIGSAEDLILYENLFEGAPVYMGLPCKSSNGNIVSFGTQLAINAHSNNKEAAWEFIKRILSVDYQRQFQDILPTNKKLFDEYMTEAMRKPGEDEGSMYTYYSINGNIWHDPALHPYSDDIEKPKYIFYYVDQMFRPLCEVKSKELSDKGLSAFMTALHTTNKTLTIDMTIISIVSEEAVSFFAGTKSIEEVCKLIQSRVQIYLNEQL